MGIQQGKNAQTGFPKRLRASFDRLGMSIKEFSDAYGVTYRTLQNYLSGERDAKADQLRLICEQSGINANWLLFGELPMLRSEYPTSDAAPITGNDEKKKLLDEQRMVRIIVQVESLLDDHNLSLSADKKAKIIALLYQLFDTEGVVDDDKVVQFLRLAS
jgi:transcriptional regulator with XRE-family HTH domain